MCQDPCPAPRPAGPAPFQFSKDFFLVMAQVQATKLLKVNARAPNYGLVMPSFPKGHFADYDPPFGPWEKPDCGPLNMRLAFQLQPS
jgi:hypothetical protein